MWEKVKPENEANQTKPTLYSLGIIKALSGKLEKLIHSNIICARPYSSVCLRGCGCVLIKI
jgi:hypothetical protein